MSDKQKILNYLKSMKAEYVKAYHYDLNESPDDCRIDKAFISCHNITIDWIERNIK